MNIVTLLLDKFISWPFVTLLGLILFKKPISDAFNRIHTFKAGKEGVTLGAAVVGAIAQAEAKPEISLSQTRTAEAERRFAEVSNIAVSPVIQQQEELIRADLRGLNLEQTQTIDLLIKHLAVTKLLYGAEFIYRTIFGSQIAIVKYLNVYGTVPRERIQAVYDDAKSRFPDGYRDYSFEQYLSYLTSQGLIATDGQGTHFDITQVGKEFLKWMADASVAENKSL